MLGQALISELKNHQIIAPSVDKVDIVNKKVVQKEINKNKPDVIINCAALTNVDQCEDHIEEAQLVNGEAVNYVAEACEKIGALLIQISTDYVFDGEKEEGYEEEDSKNPINVYGHSKAIAEDFVQKICTRYYIARTAWLFGESKDNFVTKMIQLAEKGRPIRVVRDQRGCPTYTKDLARAIHQLILDEKPSGIYHITNSEPCTWYEFAAEIFLQKKLEVDLQPCTSEEFPRPAARPKNSVLLSTKFPPLRSWKEALKEYLGS